MTILDRFLNLGWNPDQHSAMHMRRLRTLSAMALVLILIGLPFLLRAIEWQIPLRMVTLPMGILLCAGAMVVLFLKHTQRAFFIASQGVILGLLVVIEGAVVSGGGIGAASQGWMVFIPMLAAMTVGKGNAMFWGAVVLLMTILLGSLEVAGHAFPNLTPAPFQQSQFMMQAVGLMLGVLIMLASFLDQLSHSETVLAAQNLQLQNQIRETEKAMSDAHMAEQAKIRFLANMSHEMRTPLNAIQGFARRLNKSLHGKLDEREQASLDSIAQSGANMLQLVEDLFDLAALDSDSLQLQSAPLDLAQLAPVLRAKLEPLAASLAVPVTIQCDHSIMALADVRRLEQVLTTLVRFSLKQARVGRIEIVMAGSGLQHAEIQVRDDAPPLQPVAQARLFDRHNHLHSQAERETGVSGLGMALAWELMRLQGGELTVTCADAGNCFQLLLPLYSS